MAITDRFPKLAKFRGLICEIYFCQIGFYLAHFHEEMQ